MNKKALENLIEEKLENLLTWLENQPADTFATQQKPGKWSNGEHLEHLRKTTRGVNKGMNINKLLLRWKFGTNNRKERSYQETQDKYLNKLKAANVKAPARFSPENITNDDKERIISWFRQEKEAMKKHISRHSDSALTKYVIPHPLVGKMSFREFVYFTALHTDHHLDLMKKYNTFTR